MMTRVLLRALAHRLAGALLAVAAASGPASAAKISCAEIGGQHREVRYEGGVELGDDERFERVFVNCFGGGYRGPMGVRLVSDGGSVDAGLGIASFLVRVSKSVGPVSIHVPRGEACISACTYIFVAGTFRTVAAGASLEPHGFSAFSGHRIDRVAAVAATKPDEKERLKILRDYAKFSRLSWLSKVLQPSIVAEPRLEWLGQALHPFSAETLTLQSLRDFLSHFENLTALQRSTLGALDSVTELVVTEVERAAAMAAFKPHLARLSGRPVTDIVPTVSQEAENMQIMHSAYMAVLGQFLLPSNRNTAGARPVTVKESSAVLERIKSAQSRRALDTSNTVNEKLWPFLATRTDAIDVEGLVKLMFSTSILYTRPIAREELCDLNLVNRDCD